MLPKFLFKLFLLGAVFLLLVLLYFPLRHVRDIRKHGFENVPDNLLSNSVSYNAKLQATRKKKNALDADILIAGSSMSLNNISGNLLSSRLHLSVWNMSSWGYKPGYVLKFLKEYGPIKSKYLVIAINNGDLGEGVPEIDEKATRQYLTHGVIVRTWLLLKKFNLNNFQSDWEARSTSNYSNNDYLSLHFDDSGSILFDSTGFVKTDIRCKTYQDTSGFQLFRKQIRELSDWCTSNGINFQLAYFPWRNDLRTPLRNDQNKEVARVLKKELGAHFVDLHEIILDTKLYADASHLFRLGAEFMTGALADSISSTSNR
jgi:hypothetical protein